jgi:hypothetical protein
MRLFCPCSPFNPPFPDGKVPFHTLASSPWRQIHLPGPYQAGFSSSRSPALNYIQQHHLFYQDIVKMDPSAPVALPIDTTNHVNAIVLPIFAALAILVTYLPLRSFYRNRNFPACNIVFVVGIQNLITVINSIIWSDGDWMKWWTGQGLCDIQGFIKIPITTAVATSLACLTKTLADAIDVDKHNFNETAALKRRALIRDILLCWTIPIIQIGLYYVVQVQVAPVSYTSEGPSIFRSYSHMKGSTNFQ